MENDGWDPIMDGPYPREMSRREKVFLVIIGLLIVAFISIAPVVITDYF